MKKRLETQVGPKTVGFTVERNGKVISAGTFDSVFVNALNIGSVLKYKGHTIFAFLTPSGWQSLDTFARFSQLRLTISHGYAKIAMLVTVKKDGENGEEKK